ncbi:hypothetical protein V6Z11_A09G224300 [Gossypium hirsutum]
MPIHDCCSVFQTFKLQSVNPVFIPVSLISVSQMLNIYIYVSTYSFLNPIKNIHKHINQKQSQGTSQKQSTTDAPRRHSLRNDESIYISICIYIFLQAKD